MNEKTNEELAKDCIERFFHDCKLRYLVHSSKIKLVTGTNQILINGRKSDIVATKTVKTVLNDKKKCVGCGGKSNYAAVVRNINTGRLNVLFFIRNKDNEFMPLTKDHITAKANGGTDTFQNLQSMCLPCNNEKADLGNDIRIASLPDEIVVKKEHYENLIQKQKDFSYMRKNIKEVLRRMPWYVKIFGVHKLIARKIKEPLENRGYYSDGSVQEDKV